MLALGLGASGFGALPYDNGMPDWPVMLHVTDRRVVVVGGGPVAARRAASLVDVGARVTVIAPETDVAIDALPGVDVQRRFYAAGDLDGAMLVVIATDDAAANGRIAADAAAGGVLVNRADAPEAGDLTAAAHRRLGPITLAVSTDGVSAAASARIADELAEAMDPAWPQLLAAVAPFRDRAWRITDAKARQSVLRRLVDEHAMRLFGDSPQRFAAYCEQLIAQAVQQQQQ